MTVDQGLDLPDPRPAHDMPSFPADPYDARSDGLQPDGEMAGA